MSHVARWSLRAPAGSLVIATALASSLLVAPLDATASPVAANKQERVLQLKFNDDLTAKSPHFDNAGSARVSVTLATRSGGAIRAAKARVATRANTAVRTPAFALGINAPRAVIRVVDLSGADALDPSTNSFSFGADFTRNARSERTGSDDNGDNLIQRGLYGNRSQYKLQLDHDRATCRIKGSTGAIEVRSPVTISAGRWYRARCTRSGSTVTISVTRWSARGAAITTLTSQSGALGSLTPATPTVPLSIGGKLSAAGKILDASDQFNGRIDNAILQIA